MSKKLLNKTTNVILWFSLLILLVFAPLFYFMTNTLYIEETDETLRLHREEFVEEVLPTFKTDEVAQWNKYNRNIQILPSRGLKSEVIFDTIYYDKLENENEPYRELNAPLSIEGKPFTYSARINLIEKRDMVTGTAKLFFAIIAILLIGILLITKISSKRIWTPFYNTLRQIQGFEIDKNKRPQFEETDIEEFNRLNNSLNRLIEKNIDIFNNQKEFVENAAHELQTPLALFQAKIDNLYQMNVPKEYSLILSSLNEDVARLNRLNKNLLLLSKIGNESDGYFDKQEITLNDFIEKHLEFFTEQANAKNIEIITQFKEKARIRCNPELAEVMINNLFLNAIRHNVKNGKIIVTVDGNALTFQNTGQDRALDEKRLFNRFAKSGTSSQGNGLGLAIVKRIAEVNHWTVSYGFDGRIHSFTVYF